MSDSEYFSDEEALGYLLLQEPFLTKILVHLVDSGLHECRRWKSSSTQSSLLYVNSLLLYFAERIVLIRV